MKFKNNIIIDGYALAKLFKVELTANLSVNSGEAAWNSIDGTFDIGLLNGVKLQVGQEIHFFGKATENIANGDAVMFAGVQGDHILIAKANPTTINSNPEYFMGLATQDFITNQFGYVTSFGNVRSLNTSSFSLGSVLYFNSSSASNGLLTSTEQSAPNAKIIVAAVVKVHATQGILSVRPHVMPKIDNLQNVNTAQSKSTPVIGDQLMVRDSQNLNVWKLLSYQGLRSTLQTFFNSLYQVILVSGSNIKTINGQSVLGSGDLIVGGSGGSQTLQQVTDLGNSTTNPIYFNGNVPFFGYGNSVFAGAEQLPNGNGFYNAQNESVFGVYDDFNGGVFVSSIYSKRNIYVPDSFYEDVLVIAGGNFAISFDIMINNSANGVWLHGRGSASFSNFGSPNVRYKIEWDNVPQDPEWYNPDNIRIQFIDDGSGYFRLRVVNDISDSINVNIIAKIL